MPDVQLIHHNYRGVVGFARLDERFGQGGFDFLLPRLFGNMTSAIE
jgi:hypothetical protein